MRGTLTQAGLLDRVTPEQLFVSVQDAAAHALERLVRPQQQREWKLGGAGLWEGACESVTKTLAEGCSKGAQEEDEGKGWG